LHDAQAGLKPTGDDLPSGEMSSLARRHPAMTFIAIAE
jgi:hypothetical protein